LSPALTVRAKLARRASKSGLALEAQILDRLAAYFELLQKWNRKVSLTSLPVESIGDEAIDRLLIEPALATRYVPSANPSMIDIGSGGGSPAVPMKLVMPGSTLRMVDTVVDAVRYEELLSRPMLHAAGDLVTIRAVRVEMKVLAEVQALLKPQGLVFLFSQSHSSERVHCPPQLVEAGNYPLLASLGSRLQILRKTV
jgi:16S rRNA (guanine527-N7)-methyltransferase